MKIYSDVLTAADLRETVAEVPGMYLHDITQLPKTKIRSVGWEIDTASTTRRRWKNGGNYGVRRIMAASRDDHGGFPRRSRRLPATITAASRDDHGGFPRRSRRLVREAVRSRSECPHHQLQRRGRFSSQDVR
jgi:hypothetical protein